ncbi:hypothetical protein NUH86_18375 [Sphingobium sp. JS3065]|uniref:hypothetical protein n=1 Tax=Sphingobium sp. JS3065 TaxID=2970925 RepID=UPI002265559D|nr:hypothetical protein [Sphingobium sp. JS3065]UZW57549.1 hypothetical protein NUH86_18375 [Sphingobium sp. JS3065]
MGANLASDLVAALIGTGGTLIVGFGGVWFGAYLNRKSALQTAIQLAEIDRHKYAQDRLWDARKDAYTAIVSGLTALDKSVDKMYDGFFNGPNDPEDYFQSSSFNEENDELWKRYRATKELYDNSVLILSDAFKVKFGEWQQDFFHYDENDIPPEVTRAHRTAMGKHLHQFVEIAKGELSTQLST